MSIFSQVIKQIYYKTVKHYSIDDIEIIKSSKEEWKSTFTSSNRILVYRTLEDKVNCIIDPHKVINNDDSMAEITDPNCKSFELSSLFSPEKKCFDVKFGSDQIPQSMISFLDEKKRISVIEMPCLENVQVSACSSKIAEKTIEQINKPILNSIDDKFQVDFYRWNPMNSLILIVSGTNIILWDLLKNRTIVSNLEPNKEQATEIKIINAEWNHTGEFIIVVLDTGVALIFDENLKAKGHILIDEDRLERVLIIDKEEVAQDRIDLYLFTCGSCEKENDFKFGIMHLSLKSVNQFFFNIF